MFKIVGHHHVVVHLGFGSLIHLFMNLTDANV